MNSESLPIIAFQGRRGAYSESAAYHLFGREIQVAAVDTFEQIHEMVERGDAQGGVLPIENSTTGSIIENYDLLLKYRLPIVGEVKLQIEHCLFALPGETIESLTKVISHPQALAQCSKFFAEHPHIIPSPYFDTAGSADRISRKKLKGFGGIASHYAADYYGLQVLAEPLANIPGSNFTRFLAIRSHAPQVSPESDKISIAFALTQNGPGALCKCLECFAKESIDIIRIESRPKTGSPWEYVFYADFAGNPFDPAVQAALEELRNYALVYKLGSYKKGETVGVEF
jgi:prephenate dehydratase